MARGKIHTLFVLGILVLSSLLCITGCISRHGANSHQYLLTADKMEIRERLSHLVRSEMKRCDMKGLSIVVAEDQAIVWEQGFGYADEVRNLPVTPRTLFRMGSLSKLFTAIAILQIAEQGKIDLDEPVQTYLPEFSIKSRFETIAPITVRNLMSHHSGLPANYLKGMFTWQPSFLSQLVDLISNEYLAFPPGSVFSYSNLGFGLLGSLVEALSGRRFERYMEESVLRPMGMDDSGFAINPRMSGLLARGYLAGKAFDEPPFGLASAGSLFSNARDMGRFMKMVFADGASSGGRILNLESLHEMFTQQNARVPLDFDIRCGLTWRLDWPGLQDRWGGTAWHFGRTLTFRSLVVLMPQRKLGVTVMCNTSAASPAGDGALGRIATESLAAILREQGERKDELLPAPDSTKLNAAEGPKCFTPIGGEDVAGDYATASGVVRVFLEVQNPGRLRVSVGDQDLRMARLSDGTYATRPGVFRRTAAESDTRLGFARIHGQLVLARTRQGRWEPFGEKVSTVAPPRAWLSRLGRYTIVNLGANYPVLRELEITYEGHLLMLHVSSAMYPHYTFRYVLTPVSDTQCVVAGPGGDSEVVGDMMRIIGTPHGEGLYYSGFELQKKD